MLDDDNSEPCNEFLPCCNRRDRSEVDRELLITKKVTRVYWLMNDDRRSSFKLIRRILISSLNICMGERQTECPS